VALQVSLLLYEDADMLGRMLSWVRQLLFVAVEIVATQRMVRSEVLP